MQTTSCRQCNNPLPPGASACTLCGTQNAQTFEEKKPWVAALLSFVIGGVGQFYNGEFGKGCLFLVVELIGTLFTAGVAYIAIMIVSVVDAYQSAQRINIANRARLEAGVQEQILQQQTNAPSTPTQPVWSNAQIERELAGLFTLQKAGIVSPAEWTQSVRGLEPEILRFCAHREKYSSLVFLKSLKDRGYLPTDRFETIKSTVLREAP